MGLSPIGGPIGKIISTILGDPGVLVRRKDGRVEEVPLSELKKRGIDPGNGDDDLWEKLKDFLYDLWDKFSGGRNLLG